MCVCTCTHAWDLLSFLYLWVDFFLNQTCKILAIISFSFFFFFNFNPSLLSCVSNTHILYYLILPHRSQGSITIFRFCSFCTSTWIISMAHSSRSLFFFSSLCNLLSFSSDFFLNLDIVFQFLNFHFSTETSFVHSYISFYLNP